MKEYSRFNEVRQIFVSLLLGGMLFCILILLLIKWMKKVEGEVKCMTIFMQKLRILTLQNILILH